MNPTQQDFVHHISAQFNSELEHTRSLFLGVGGLVEQQVQNAIHALLDTDVNLATSVENMDKQVNRTENQIDAELVKILALRQPAASDLRMVMAISKSITDLERIGDEATKVARIAVQLIEEGESPRGYTEARHIGSLVRVMLHDALDCFARLDAEKAFKVMQADADVDREYQSATRALMTYLMEDPRYVSRVINVLWVLRALERIGDHARNIAEQVIYVAKGADVRHANYEEVEQKISR